MFKKGDVVRCIEETVSGSLTNGTLYLVLKDQNKDINGMVTIVNDNRQRNKAVGEGYYARRFVLNKDAAIIGAPQPVKLTKDNAQVGMKVVLADVNGNVALRKYKIGDVFTIEKINDVTFRSKEMNENNFYFKRFNIAPEAQVIGVGTKLICVEGMREAGLRRDKVVTIKTVGKNVYYTKEFPGKGFAKRRFEFLANAPVAPVAPPPPVEKPLGKGDKVYLVKVSKNHASYRNQWDDMFEDGIPLIIEYPYDGLFYVRTPEGMCYYVPQADVARSLPAGFKPRPPFNGDLRAELHHRDKHPSAVVSFAYVAKDCQPAFLINPACFAPMRYAKYFQEFVVSTKGVATLLDKKQQATVRVYFDYLLNRSPWSPCFITKDVDEALEKGIVMNVDVPVGQMVGAAITIREATEFPGRLKMFQWAIDNGLSGDVGYMFGYAVAKQGADHFSVGGGGPGHSAFTCYHSLTDATRFFANGFPNKDQKTAREGTDMYTIDAMITNGGKGQALNVYMDKNVVKVQVGEGFYKNLVITSESIINLGKSLEQLIAEEKK